MCMAACRYIIDSYKINTCINRISSYILSVIIHCGTNLMHIATY